MWGVFAVYKGERKKKKFDKEEDARKYYNSKRESLESKGVLVGVVSLSKAFPVDKKVERPMGSSFLWCPYCMCYREFVLLDKILHCPLCGVSVNDFHVKSCNKLWPKIRKQLKEDKRRDKK